MVLIFYLVQEEIVDETDEFVDVHRRYFEPWTFEVSMGALGVFQSWGKKKKRKGLFTPFQLLFSYYGRG